MMKKGLLLFIFSLAAGSAFCSPFTKTFYIDGKYIVQKVTVEEVEEYNEKGLLVTDTIPGKCTLTCTYNKRNLVEKRELDYFDSNEKFIDTLKYNRKGLLIEVISKSIGSDSNECEYVTKYKYNKDNKMIESKDSEGEKTFYIYTDGYNHCKTQKNGKTFAESDYDEKGNLLHAVGFNSPHNYEVWYGYDDSGFNIYEKDNEEMETLYTKDEKGNLQTERNSREGLYIYDYEFWDNGNMRKRVKYHVED